MFEEENTQNRICSEKKMLTVEFIQKRKYSKKNLFRVEDVPGRIYRRNRKRNTGSKINKQRDGRICTSRQKLQARPP